MDIELGVPDYTGLSFPEAPSGRPYVICNMVASVDGKVVIEGTERGLGSPVDQQLMRELRLHADAVMNGAGTLRASGTSSKLPEHLQRLRTAQGKPPHPLAAVLTASGDLPLERAFFTNRTFEAVVFVTNATPAERRAAIEATGRRVVSAGGGGAGDDIVGAVLRHLREELDVGLLLVEGGPRLNGELFGRGYVDEYFCTMAPRIVGGEGGLTAVQSAEPASFAGTTALEVVSAALVPETSELYLRYRVGRRGISP